MWYVIHTVEEKEKELVNVLNKKKTDASCKDCFVLMVQRLKRLGGEWQIQTDVMFPGYVFVETDAPEIVNKWLCTTNTGYILKSGRSSKQFIPIEPEEELFWRLVTRGDQVRTFPLTTVELLDTGEILRMDGVLTLFRERINKINLRKRYALVNISISDEVISVLFGIRLLKDPASKLNEKADNQEEDLRMDKIRQKNKDEKNTNQEKNKFESCVLCGQITDVPVARDIQQRECYVEGAGQLCHDCYKKVYREYR